MGGRWRLDLAVVTTTNDRLGRVAILSAFGHIPVLLTILSDAVAQLASAFGLYVRVLASGVASTTSTTIRYDMIR